MDTPHISARPVPKKEVFNNNPNDAMTLGINRKYTTNQNAIAPKHKPEKQMLVHPYKLQNFTNEYCKDISLLYNDPCLIPDYSITHNIKDKKYRGNQFGVRYNRNKIFNRPTYDQKYSNSRLLAQYPLLSGTNPWFQYNWANNQQNQSDYNQSLTLTNNRQDVYRNYFKSHPYFYYRDQTSDKFCEQPITQVGHMLEGFSINGNSGNWFIYILLLVAILYLWSRY